MKFICLDNWNDLPQSSNLLFAQSQKESLFFSREWFEEVVTPALKDDESLLLACIVDGENVLAILPLIQRDNREWSSLCHLYSSLYTVLLATDHQQEILACLCQGLSQLPFDYLSLEPVAEDDSHIISLQQMMESSGLSCTRYYRFYNWFHRVEGQTFAEYMADRPSQVRNTIARKARKLEREHGYEICLHTGGDVQQAMADYNAAYEASWKASEQFGKLLDAMSKSLAKPGWPRLAILYIEEQPVAAQLWFVTHRKAIIFRLAHDETWKRYSPGSILTRYLMEYVIDTDKVEEIDFLVGNERYKQNWMAQRRERWGMVCVHTPKPQEKSNPIIRSLKGLLKKLN
ncbi:MAG: GNAT family N-acetyltransferase [uncultured Thiotrichaceae bacterium]|uniref:GNAT family N-acetyltransferase n=1 Tax=uncultured Thiotrichaceae bacterium TaxID=298394 RepID=A0A6S6SV33_9GAMM|nr:MAG: GNAT family N-acetyltransferase [uncultured Thiotrichaceae bacterium]